MKHSKFHFKIVLFLLCIFAFQTFKKKDKGTSFYLYNDKLIVSDDQGGKQKSALLCLIQNSGSVVWKADFNNLNRTQPVIINFDGPDQTYYKNYLFSDQCDNLLIVDLNNGSVFLISKLHLAVVGFRSMMVIMQIVINCLLD